jgi:hypothetical protein
VPPRSGRGGTGPVSGTGLVKWEGAQTWQPRPSRCPDSVNVANLPPPEVAVRHVRRPGTGWRSYLEPIPNAPIWTAGRAPRRSNSAVRREVYQYESTGVKM